MLPIPQIPQSIYWDHPGCREAYLCKRTKWWAWSKTANTKPDASKEAPCASPQECYTDSRRGSGPSMQPGWVKWSKRDCTPSWGWPWCYSVKDQLVDNFHNIITKFAWKQTLCLLSFHLQSGVIFWMVSTSPCIDVNVCFFLYTCDRCSYSWCGSIHQFLFAVWDIVE